MASDLDAQFPYGTVGTLCAVGFAASLMQTIAFPLMPDFPVLLNSTPENVSWIVTANTPSHFPRGLRLK